MVGTWPTAANPKNLTLIRRQYSNLWTSFSVVNVYCYYDREIKGMSFMIVSRRN